MSDRSMHRLSPVSLLVFATLSMVSVVLAGCGLGTVDTSTAAGVTPAVEGTAFGGSTPITGATMTLWETDPTSSGYPSASNEKAKALETTTTADGTNGTTAGTFSFNPGYTCDTPATGTAAPFLYITATGGTTGAGTNNSYVLIATLGPCSAIQPNASSVHVSVNESSTVAAAYALGNFMYVDDTNPGAQQVYIGAPATNNATTGSCTGTGSTMTCVAAGLSHAFQNAFNLSDSVGLTHPSGQAKTTISANPFTGAPANPNSSVPYLELNTLADILSTCVNSNGGTPCTTLYALTTNAAGTAAGDTLTAAINIAQNPGHNIGVAGPPTTGLWSLVPAGGPFQPSLTAPPHDWSVGISYSNFYNPATATATATALSYSYTAAATTGTVTVTATNSFVAGQTVTLSGFTSTSTAGTVTTGTATVDDVNFNSTTVQITSATSSSFTGISSFIPSPTTASVTYTSAAGDSGVGTVSAANAEPEAVALDANDNVYAPAVTSVADGVLVSLASNGTVNWITSPMATVCGGFNVATDTVSNVWVANYSSSTLCPGATYGLYGFSQAAGTLTQSLTNASTANIQSAPWGLAVDRFNNLWYGRKSTTCQTAAGTGTNVNPVCVAEIPYSAGSYGAAQNLTTFGSSKLFNITHLVLDANQNVWAGAYEGLTGSSYYPIGIIPNTGTAASPTYGGSAYAAAVSSEAYGLIALDAAGDLWTGSATSGGPESVYYYTYSGSVSAATGAYNNTTNTGFNPSKPIAGEFDGNGKLFFVSQSSSGQLWFYSPANQTAGDTATTVAFNLVPCYNGSGGTTCGVSTTYPDMAQIDSTGSVWVAAGETSFATVGTTGGFVVQVIGTAAPAWPQLSYAKFGVKP